MFGVVIGTLCLVAFFAVWRRRGWHRFGAYGYCGRSPGRFGYGPSRFAYRTFEALDTSPGQEKAIRLALGELRSSFAELRPELDATRAQLAQTLSGEHFDSSVCEATLERQAASLGRMAPITARTLAQIHEALDPDQRRRLARLIEKGPGYCAV